MRIHAGTTGDVLGTIPRGAYEKTPDGIYRKSLDILLEKPLCEIIMVNLYKLKKLLEAHFVNYTLGGNEPANC